MSTSTIKESRSSLQFENLQEHLDASASAKQVTQTFGQQYQTPEHLAEFFNGLLPSIPSTAFDPQCASGNTMSGMSWSTRKFGFEIDNRFRDKDDNVERVIGNCVKAYEALDDLYPALRFECQVANPPFGIQWKMTDGGKCDSTEYTWRKIMERAAIGGFGWFIANHKTIERLGLHRHERVYLYQKFPAGVWKNCEVEIGVVHWRVGDHRPHRQELAYLTLNLDEHAAALQQVRDHFDGLTYFQRRGDECAGHEELSDAITTIQEVLDEERKKLPPFNIWLDQDGKLRAHLSVRTKAKRKISQSEILRLSTLNHCHAVTLTTDKETRKLLSDLITSGTYTIQPEAAKAITDALAEVKSLACPIMPVTDFETVAYADEEDALLCVADAGFAFTAGRKYEVSTATYKWSGDFTRLKTHFSEADGSTYQEKHKCRLSGSDRYIAVTDDDGVVHRFMDKPQNDNDHEEAVLWKIFQRPVVRTIAEERPEVVAKNREILTTCELLADFKYYPGQFEYLARVAVKDNGLIAADVGTGKTLCALSLIQLKGPKRALIVAPQGTMRSGEDDDDAEEYQASQWIQELRRFAPGLPVFQLFNYGDYLRILKANDGELPFGVFITYYQAMFLNEARESIPDTWDDAKLQTELQRLIGDPTAELPEAPADCETPDRYWCESVGHEVNGIRCLVTPCLATRIGHLFDMVCLDEAHLICNLGAITSQMAIRLQPRYRYALTATPIPNVITNMFSIMGWLSVPDWYKGERRNAAWPYAREDIGRFEQTFLSLERDFTEEARREEAARKSGGRWSGKCEKVSPVISSPARLLKILKPTLAFISKEQCNTSVVPCKTVDIRVPLGREQAKLYQHFLNRGNIPAKNPLVRARKQIAWLRNITADPAGFRHGGPKVKSNFNPKTVAILELTREILGRGEQVVIVCSRLGQSDTLHARLTEAGVRVARIDSTVRPENHSVESNLFKSGKARVLIMGIKCAMGHSYPDCPNLIIGSLEYSYGSKHQAEGRVWRVNSRRPVTVYCILHRHTIEETMYDVVATKQDAATICLRGQRVPREFKPVDLGEVLAMSIQGFDLTGIVSEADCESNWPKLRSAFLGAAV